MDNLRGIIMKAVSNLTLVLGPLHEQDDRIKLQIDQSISLADGLAHLGARDALIQPQIEAISSQKDLVEAAAAKCEPEGKDKELVTAFFYLVKTLQSDCRKTREDIQAWDEILNAVDSLDNQKQKLNQEEAKRIQQILGMKAKDDRQKDLLRLALSVMSEELRSSHQGENSATARDSTSIR